MITIRPIVVRRNRKTGTALILALMLALHSVVLCAGAVPSYTTPSASACHHQEQGCPERQRHEQHESQRCVCCESLVCAPRAELTRPDGRSATDRIAALVPICIAVLSLDLAHNRGSLLRVSESPPHSPIRVFLIQKALLI